MKYFEALTQVSINFISEIDNGSSLPEQYWITYNALSNQFQWIFVDIKS